MSKMSSTMVALETKALPFSLLDVVSGQVVSPLENKEYKAHVIMFICNHCPYVKHIQTGLVALARDYLAKGVQCIAISANDVVNYPADSPEKMRELAVEEAFPFVYLYDESQEVAKAYHAACTPDFFVYDSNLLLRYRGQLDDSRPGNGIAVSARSLRAALDAILDGRAVPGSQVPSIGCSIKWKEEV